MLAGLVLHPIMLVPEAPLEALKCSVCLNYLSYFPIHLSDENRTLCGRCPAPKGGHYIKDEIYETLAEFLQFPCRSNAYGCSEVLFPSQMPDHEATCGFKPVDCPTQLFTDCLWQGSYYDQVKHCEELHSDLIDKNGDFHIDPDSSFRKHQIIRIKDDLLGMNIVFHHTTKIIECSVIYIVQEEENNKYIVQVSVGSNNEVYAKFPVSKITFPANIGIKSNYTAITIESLPVNADSVIPCYIKVCEIVDLSNQHATNNADQIARIISKFKCSICLKYDISCMSCVKGHVACLTCCHQRCRICCRNQMNPESGIQDQHFRVKCNFLDEASKFLLIPCKNLNNGCHYKCAINEMNSHEDLCRTKKILCPFNIKCYATPFIENLSRHICDSHEIQTSNWTSTITLQQSTRTEVKAVKFSRFIFTLRCQFDLEQLVWAVFLVNDSQPSQNFKFEIDLVDSRKEHQRFCVTTNCTSIETNLTNIKKINLSYDQVKHMCSSKSEITYRFRIFK